MHVLHNRLGLVGTMRSSVHLLPLTMQAIDEVVETSDEYNLRRLADSAETCRR